MKRRYKVISLLMCVWLCGCAFNKKSSRADFNIEQSAEKNYDSEFNVLCDKGECFEIYTNSNGDMYLYAVKDSENNYLDFGYHSGRGSLRFFESFGLLCLEYGVGGSTWYERYYDIEKGKVSRFFEMPYLGYNNLVACFFATKQIAKYTAKQMAIRRAVGVSIARMAVGSLGNLITQKVLTQ